MIQSRQSLSHQYDWAHIDYQIYYILALYPPYKYIS